MRKRLLVLLMAAFMVVMSAAPAMARQDGLKPAQPVTPPGIERSQVDRPEQAPTPETGAGNRFFHGSPQNGK